MKNRFLAIAVLAMAAIPLHATLLYNAYISGPSSVTVSVSWANEPTAIGYVEVDDYLGNFLFALNVGAPSQTGTINPDPQTVSGLSPNTIFLISNGQAGVAGPSLTTSSNLNSGPFDDASAYLNLKDEAEGTSIDGTDFTASVPEPAAWSMALGGIGLLLLRKRRTR